MLMQIRLCRGTVQTGWFMRLKKIKMAMRTHSDFVNVIPPLKTLIYEFS